MKKKYDVVFTEEYTDKEGVKQKNYTNIGVVFENENGYLSMKLNFLPMNLDKGFINLMNMKNAGH